MTSTQSRSKNGGEPEVEPTDKANDDSDIELMPEDDIDPRQDRPPKRGGPPVPVPPRGEPTAPPAALGPDSARSELVTRMMRQALAEMAAESPIAIADWIAQVVDPRRPTTRLMFCDRATSVGALSRAKAK